MTHERILAALAIAGAIALAAASPLPPADDDISLDCYLTSSRGPQAPSTGPVFVRVRLGPTPKVESLSGDIPRSLLRSYDGA